jgi:hypothetical protein
LNFEAWSEKYFTRRLNRRKYKGEKVPRKTKVSFLIAAVAISVFFANLIGQAIDMQKDPTSLMGIGVLTFAGLGVLYKLVEYVKSHPIQ